MEKRIIKIKEIDKKRDYRICPTCRKRIALAKLYYIEFGDKVFHIDCFINKEYDLMKLEGFLSEEEIKNIDNELKEYTKEFICESL